MARGSLERSASGSAGTKRAARIGVLSNLKAGQGAVRASLMHGLLSGQRNILHIATNNGGNVAEVLEAFADAGVNVLIVNGGDGTLQQVLTAMLGQRIFDEIPLVAPLRSGRTNIIALDIGCRRNTVAALTSVVAASHSGTLGQRVEIRPVLRIELGSPDRLQYGMFCGVGVIYRAVDLIQRAFPPGKLFQGTIGATALAAVLFARAAMGSTASILTSDRMDVRLDETCVPTQAYQLVMATTLRRLLLKTNPFWGREAAPIRVTTVAAGAQHKWRYAPGILRGQPGRGVRPETGYTSRNAHRVELRLDSGLCIDGELFPAPPGGLVRIDADDRIRFVRA